MVMIMRYHEDRIGIEELAVAAHLREVVPYKRKDQRGEEVLDFAPYDGSKDYKGYPTRLGLDEYTEE